MDGDVEDRSQFNSVIPDDTDDDVVPGDFSTGYRLARRIGASSSAPDDEDDDQNRRPARNAYLRRGMQNISLSPDRSTETSYKEALEANELERERQDLLRKIEEMKRTSGSQPDSAPAMGPPPPTISSQRTAPPSMVSESDESGTESKAPKKRSRWDQTPQNVQPLTSETEADLGANKSKMLQESLQRLREGTGVAEPPKRSRWDQTPATATGNSVTQTPLPSSNVAPVAPRVPLIQSQATTRLTRFEDNLREWTDEDLDAMLPSEGFEIVTPPDGYGVGSVKASLLSAPTPLGDGLEAPTGFSISQTRPVESYGIAIPKQLPTDASGKPASDLPIIKPEDMHYFGKLLDARPESMTREEEINRNIMFLLLKIKNGVPSVRKQAMRQITDDAPKLGAGPLFNQILPLLMSPTLDEQERHLLVKVVDRVLFRLEDAVRPFAHKILAIIAPMLIEEDYYARVEGREIISNLAKACGLATMIATMRPDIDNPDDFVRNTTARALSVVASALGIQSMCPFIRAVCRSKRSWEARHTGIKVVQQISILMGCGVLPHLQSLVDCIAPGLKDEQQKIRTMTALSLASLAEAAHPYGYESFIPILDDLWDGIFKHRGKGLAAFLKCVGCIVPLMDEDNASDAVQRLTPILVREFESPDEDTKKIVLKALKQCAATQGVTAAFLRENVLPGLFASFWVRRNAMDRKNFEAVVDTTLTVATRVGAGSILEKLVDHFKDESEPFRRMVTDCTERILKEMGAADVNTRLEERLVDGVLFAFQEQGLEDPGNVMLRGFIRVIESLGQRAKPYLAQIAATAKWRLQHKSPAVRTQAADLIGGLAPVMKTCHEEELLGHLGVLLYENLGEEFPDVLGSILGALKHIVVNLGVDDMNPPIRDLLPRLTPILRNSNEKVAENLIELVGRVADMGASQVAAREWMRICFDLLEMLRSPRMSIRRAAVSTFGFIARAVGPQDVLHTLLTNLRVQERQMRVCTTVAIAIVAESCAPFTVLPGLMNEYRTPDINVQNGVLKALSFMLQYIGPMAVDYVYALTPLLQSALSDRDHVHRQTACDAVKHLALGVAGRGCEDSLTHLLNYVFPNIFEQSPHVARAVLESIEALRVPLGAGKILLYLLPGLFHPARFVRQVYWRLYNNLYVGETDALVPSYPRFELVPSLARVMSESESNGMDAFSSSTVLSLKTKPETLDQELSSRDMYRRTYYEMFI